MPELSKAKEVLVVGAGPTGLTLAHELRRRGVTVRLVDGAAGPSPTSRSMATHARTLEMYDQMGVLPQILTRGRRVQHFSMYQRGRRLVRFGPDYSELPTRFPFTVVIDQSRTEEVLRGSLRDLGVEVEWGTRLESLSQDSGGVRAHLRDSHGNVEEYDVPWLVGCDGGHSTVRNELGLRLQGDSSETWLIADAESDLGLPGDSLHLMHVSGGSVMAVPFPDEGKWRLLDTVDVDYDGSPEHVAQRFAAKLSAGCGRRVKVSPPSWVSVFTIQQRMIPRMGAGRCFVAGDAAHVHSPASGQGMNTGIQDAVNLSWKLAMVVRGQAEPGLLDTYGAERVPVGEHLLSATKTATRFVSLKDALQSITMPLAFFVIRNVPAIRGRIERTIMRGMTALALDYTGSPLAITTGADSDNGPRPGERMTKVTQDQADQPSWKAFLEQLREPVWTLLTFGDGWDEDTVDELRSVCSDWLSVLRIDGGGTGPGSEDAMRERLGTGPDEWLLVRPDGYLCARGSRLPELDAAMRSLHLTRRPKLV